MSNHIRCEAGKGGISVAVRNNDIDKAIRVFKKIVLTEGLIKEIKSYQAYEKPSVKRRRVRAEAVRRMQKELRLRKKHEGY